MADKVKTEQAFRGLVSEITDEAKKALRAEGFFPLAVIVVTAEGDLQNVDLQEHMDAAEELHAKGRHEEAIRVKKEAGLAIRELLRNVKAIGYITAGLSSVSTQVKREDIEVVHGEEPGKGRIRGLLPRFDPRRRDAIVVNWEWKGEGVYKAGLAIQFFRRERGRIILEESQSSEGEPTVGLLTGLLGR